MRLALRAGAVGGTGLDGVGVAFWGTGLVTAGGAGLVTGVVTLPDKGAETGTSCTGCYTHHTQILNYIYLELFPMEQHTHEYTHRPAYAEAG